MKRKGLTLMELLVVISILATLAALLFPVYLKVRKRIHAINCANQLRQIGLAIRMYAHDQGDDTPYSMPIRLGQLYPSYVKDKDLLVCPYFRTLATDIVEELHQISQKNRGRPWHSYMQVTPAGWDDIARKYPEEVSFSEAYGKRGDQVPIICCDAHRYGCPKTYGAITITASPKGEEFVKIYCNNPYVPYPFGIGLPGILYSPNEPLIILRWSGSVHFVHKPSGLSVDANVLLLDY